MVSKEVHILYRYIVGTLKNVIFGIYSLHFLSRSFLRWETRIFWRPWLSEVAHLAANSPRTTLGSTPHGTRCWGRGHNEGEWGGKEARSAWLGLHFPSKTKQNVCTLATWNASLAEGVRANDSLFKGTWWPFFCPSWPLKVDSLTPEKMPSQKKPGIQSFV